ncbi:MAG TPA: FAD-dependent oxidoreductase [Steroidobacteraceae bacterium]|nr:FAD-dependent oxidoreductase [Steroidobacteraceae bacterium]
MRPLRNTHEVTVIGGGLAGLAAARHAAHLGRSVTLFEGRGIFGGLVATIHEVDGIPVPGKFSGQDLAIHLLEEARKAAVQVVERSVAKIELNAQLTLTDEQSTTYHPDAIIIASGASLRRLGVAREEEFVGRGVSRCATCDGGFFRGQDVVVVGGGDGAAQEALVLAKTSRRVIMVCRSPLKAKRHYIEKLAARENVSFVWDSEVSAILGDDAVSGVRLRNVRDGTSSDLECMGLFPFIGVTPNTEFAPPSLLGASGHVKTNAALATGDSRVFAVGAARAGYGGAIVQAMAEGVGAAEAVARLLH